MRVIILIIGLAFGLYFIIADRLKLPYLKTSKAIMNMGKSDKSLTSTIEAVIMDLSMKLARFIPMDKYKKNRLKESLKAAGIKMTPECYQAHAIVKAVATGLLIIPCLVIFPLLSIVVLVLAILIYFKEMQKVENLLKERREEIDSELLRFASTVKQELYASRDVLSILETFKKNTTPTFAEEIGITCADMRSGSYEIGLRRLEARINSSQLSDVVRGLIAVMHGDNGVMYFEMLEHDFKQAEMRKLKSKAQKVPGKIRIFSMLMLMCFIGTYLVIIASIVINSIGVMF